MSPIAPDAAQTVVPDAGRARFEIELGEGKTLQLTTTRRAEDGIGEVCPGKLYFAGGSETNWREFRCDGTGSFVNDCEEGQNSGSFRWGFVLDTEDPSRLVVKSFRDWGWGQPTDDKAAEIVMRFEGGCQDGEVIGGILGVIDGQIVQGMGYGYVSPR